MKPLFSFLLAIMLLPIFSFSQTPIIEPQTLFIVNGSIKGKELLTHHLIIDLKDIEKFDVLNIAEVKKQYGNNIGAVAVRVTPKSSVKLIGLSEFLQIHNIRAYNDSLHVRVDSDIRKNPKDMIIEDSEVKSVVLNNDTIIISTNSGYRRLLKANKKVQ